MLFGSSLSLKGWEALGNTETDLPDKNEFYVSFFRLLSVPIRHEELMSKIFLTSFFMIMGQV